MNKQKKAPANSQINSRKTGPYCVCADPDTGLIDAVVSLQTATNQVNLGWHILPGTITYDINEAEKSLRQWRRRPRRLQKELERLIIT